MPPPGFIIDNPTVNILVWLLLNYSHKLLGEAPHDFSWATAFYFPQIPAMYRTAPLPSEGSTLKLIW